MILKSTFVFLLIILIGCFLEIKSKDLPTNKDPKKSSLVQNVHPEQQQLNYLSRHIDYYLGLTRDNMQFFRNVRFISTESERATIANLNNQYGQLLDRFNNEQSIQDRIVLERQILTVVLRLSAYTFGLRSQHPRPLSTIQQANQPSTTRQQHIQPPHFQQQQPQASLLQQQNPQLSPSQQQFSQGSRNYQQSTPPPPPQGYRNNPNNRNGK